ncbi:MAG: hypothetical protein NVSMB46_03200 [Candidatus Saccharimonadales bacterium]
MAKIKLWDNTIPSYINILRLAYIFGLILFMIIWHAFWTPDALFIILLIGFILWGQGKQFLLRFTPFILLLLSYDALRGFASIVNKHVHYTFMANFDRFIFGVLPTSWLQQQLYAGHLHWYDFYFYGLYMLHFIVPIIFAIILWKKRVGGYSRFIVGLLILSYGGFITYILYPAAPPWMSAQLGYIEHLHRISSDVWYGIGVHNFPSLYHHFAPNDVAAVPSLHAAYPTLVWLFSYRFFDKKYSIPLLLYPVSIWFGVIYLGEHYVFDVLLGIIYAFISYIVANKLLDIYITRKVSKARRNQKQKPITKKKALTVQK